MFQCLFTGCNKCTIPVQVVDSGRACGGVGQDVKSLNLPLNIAVYL